MECEATASVEVLKIALPELRVAVPKLVEPFLKVTFPVGVVPNAGLTVAVNVTAWPNTDGFAEEASVVVVDDTLTV
jgi:hypothetical protein